MSLPGEHVERIEQGVRGRILGVNFCLELERKRKWRRNGGQRGNKNSVL